MNPSSSNPKQAVFAALADIAKAFASPHRIEIIEVLGQGERTVDGVAARLGLPIANASQHLRLMRQSGLLVSRRAGRHIIYGLSNPRVVEALKALTKLGEIRSAEIRSVVAEYFNARDAMEPVSRAELTDRLRDDAVTVLDVRPNDEFAAGRLPSARNIPLAELASRIAELPRDQEVVAYCRGPYCVLAFEAVALLRNMGFDARRLEDGFPEWKAAGMPISVGESAVQ